MSGIFSKIAIIGCGAMGEAFLNALLQRKLTSPSRIICSCATSKRCSYLANKYGVMAITDNLQVLESLGGQDDTAAQSGQELVFLAIGPQALPQIMAELRGKFRSHQILLSILAGVSLNTLQEGFEHACVVRAMPNLPAKVAEAMTVWIASHEVSESQCALAAQFLASVGQEVQVQSENELNMATALSGSGPAYVFLFLESLIDAGVHMGLSRSVSEVLSRQCLKGALALVEESGQHPALLKNQVTTPGGTTAEALHYFESKAFRSVVGEAVMAAYRRSLELGKH